MDFGEFSDVNLDNSDTGDFKYTRAPSTCGSDEAKPSILAEKDGDNVAQSSVNSYQLNVLPCHDCLQPGYSTLLDSHSRSTDESFEPYDDFSDKRSHHQNSQFSTSELNQHQPLSETNMEDSASKPYMDPDSLIQARRKRFGSESLSESSASTICTDETRDCKSQAHVPLGKQTSRSSIDELLFELYDKHSSKSSQLFISAVSSQTSIIYIQATFSLKLWPLCPYKSKTN